MGVALLKGCGLVGGGVALLEEVWPCWRRCGLVGGGVLQEVGLGLWGFRCSSQAMSHSVFLLPVDPDIEFLVSS